MHQLMHCCNSLEKLRLSGMVNLISDLQMWNYIAVLQSKGKFGDLVGCLTGISTLRYM